jgi:hypothetical protein
VKPAPVAPRPIAPTPVAPPPAAKAAEETPAPPAASADPAAPPPADVAAIRARWAEVIERAPPAIKPLLRECRPIGLDGVRLTLAFPEERGFMREKARTRAEAIEQLLGGVLGGSWAVECVASNVELEPLTLQQAVAADPSDPDGRALLEGVLRITGGELVDAPEVH